MLLFFPCIPWLRKAWQISVRTLGSNNKNDTKRISASILNKLWGFKNAKNILINEKCQILTHNTVHVHSMRISFVWQIECHEFIYLFEFSSCDETILNAPLIYTSVFFYRFEYARVPFLGYYVIVGIQSCQNKRKCSLSLTRWLLLIIK